MRRLVVVGGGIAGLAAAWSARQSAGSIAGGLDVLVLEQAKEVGGKARSLSVDGWLVEGGPGGFLSGRAELDELIAGAGLTSDVTPADTASARRFLFSRGKIRRIVNNPVGFLGSGVLSVPGFVRVLAEPFIPAKRDRLDESVWSFAKRRLGEEAANRLVLPMVLGIFAGDARQLSLAAAFPRMEALERDHGSIIRGFIAKRGKTASGRLTSFRGGMQRLPLTLAREGGFAVRCNARVLGVARSGSAWHVMVAGDREAVPADAVVFAGEPWSMAPLVRAHDAQAASDLDSIPCPPVAVVSFGYDSASSAGVPRGFGMLIARGEGFRMLGNLWDSHLYPGRSPAGHLLMRAMYGGAVDPEAAMLGEDELVALARSEVSRLYGITEAPRFQHVVQWERAIPQPLLGHGDRATRIERGMALLPGLFITGAGLRGVAFADAAQNGARTGKQAAEWLARR